MRYTLDSVLPFGAFQPRGGVFARGMTLHGGAGGFIEDIGGAIGDVFEGAGDVVGDVFEGAGDVLASIDPGPMLGDVAQGVGSAVEDVGGFVQDIGQGAIDIVGDAGVFLDDAVNDVVPGGWATVGAAALAAATYGGSLAAEGAALGASELAAAELMGPTIAELGAQAATTGLGEALGAGAFDALAADALASGQISGLTSGATDALLAQGTMDAATIANLSADPIGTLNAINNWTGPMTGNIGTVAAELASQGVAESEVAKYLASQYGIDAYAAANAAGIANAGGTAESIAEVLAADYGAEMAGIAGAGAAGLTGAELLAAAKNAMQVAQLAKSGYGLVNQLTGGTGNVRAASPLLRTASLGSTLGGGTSSGGGGSGALPGSLESTFLAAAPVTQGSNMNLNQLKQLYPQLSTIDPKLLQTLMGRAAATSAMGESGMGGGTTGLSMAGQGGTPSAGYPAIAADRSTGATRFTGDSPLSGKFSALSAAGLDALGGSRNAYGLKDGGQPHIPQFKTGTTGHYVQGEGDGQSDDIPAMLADGEYVFDADTVAALGNGSNKAGALQLDRMRQEIRKHKRSAPHNKIPPKAKSPLEYMKEGK
jgi:hypothetical protein